MHILPTQPFVQLAADDPAVARNVQRNVQRSVVFSDALAASTAAACVFSRYGAPPALFAEKVLPFLSLLDWSGETAIALGLAAAASCREGRAKTGAHVCRWCCLNCGDQCQFLGRPALLQAK